MRLPSMNLRSLFSSKWKLDDLEAFTFIDGQFIPEDLSYSGVQSDVITHPAPTSPKPPISWMGLKPESMSFLGMFFATNVTDRVIPDLNKLLKMAKYDDKLYRPHKVLFHVGSDITFGPAIIESITDIKYTYRVNILTGNVRSVRFQVNLRLWSDIPELTSPASPEPSTRYLLAKTGDTFEGLAWQEYGRANLGIKVRQLHPDFSELQPGDQVKLLPPEHSFMRLPIKPQTEALQDKDFVNEWFNG